MNWFEELTGTSEAEWQQERSLILLKGARLFTVRNQRSYVYGRLETPSLADLRDAVPEIEGQGARSRLQEVVADVQDLHADPSNAGAMFQVASQFNLLEMPGPNVCPEDGISNYQYDHTQGPACAIACGAATIYRNYFHEVEGQKGQSWNRQVDCLKGMGELLGNDAGRLWRMQNGYALPTREGLVEIAKHLNRASEEEIEQLRDSLRIGIQWFAEVTRAAKPQLVSQAYCSALPVAYTEHPKELWEPFARLVLEAAYEATLWAAMQNAREGNHRLFLTLLGGGAFGNRKEWILDALHAALDRCPATGLDIRIVSYGHHDRDVCDLVETWGSGPALL